VTRSAEGQGTTVDEAIREALRDIGLTAEEVFVEILSEGKRGLFGAARRAHVRVVAKQDVAAAAVEPRRHSGNTPHDHEEDGVAVDNETPLDEVETGTEPEDTGDHGNPRDEMSPEEWLDLLDQESELAADFIEGLLDRLDLPGDLEIEVTPDQALVNIQDLGSGLLIGRRGATLDALQELVRSAVQRQTQRRSHVRVDVEGYRARTLEKLRDKCREAIAEVRETGKPVRLEPMDAYERKMMHDLVSKTGGVTSSSEGSEPKRRVVIEPA
jgi:spoIIIJ-associated protein